MTCLTLVLALLPYDQLNIAAKSNPLHAAFSPNPERFVEINSKASIWMPMMGRTLVTDWAIEDGSFLRCSNLTLGYTLPVTVTRKLGVKNLRVYATANNLFCWTAYSGQDPEVSTQRSTPLTPGVDYSAYPKAHSYVFGLNVTF